MDYLNKLNANHAAAARWDTGPLLVLAGPGSGKTATLTARVARLVEESGGESFRILCLTFTRKAAAEMRERLLTLVPDARERVLLATFHSFATDILRQHGSHFGLSPDFEIIEEVERVALLKAVLPKNADELTKFVSADKALTSVDVLLSNVTPDADVPTQLKDEEKGEKQVVIMPYFLAPGRHWNEDIPQLAAEAASPFLELGVTFLVAPPLGLHPLMLRVIDDRVREGLESPLG